MESASFGALLYLKEDKHTFVGDANYLYLETHREHLHLRE
jgi:hypothetical protein